jgi:hypothetical protein
MKARQDVAAPSIIDPAAFHFVAGCYFAEHVGEGFDALLGEWMAEKNPDGSAAWYQGRRNVRDAFKLDPNGNFAVKGTCDHCGAHFLWGAIYQHVSGSHIVVGNICADKTLSVPSRAHLMAERLRSRIAAEKKAAGLRAAALKQAEADGIAWLYASKHENRFLVDIARKGLLYGGLTVRQLEFVKRIHSGEPAEWEVKKAAQAAARAAEEAAALPVPVTDERIVVRGVVLSVKEQQGYMPGSYVQKILVKSVDGWKVWGSSPSRAHAQVGRQIEFKASVQRSPDDPKFGFFKRPHLIAACAE